MATIELSNIAKTYPGNVQAIRQADFSITDGEFVVLVGPSGCGKSTILRMIAGLETVTRGDILIGGEEVNDLEPGDRDIAMVFQNYALYPHMSVYANMAYGLKNSGMKRDAIDERIAKAAQILQLDEYLKRKPSQLSGGQRQRVAMGRAIVREPKVFLFDEPLSNLDAKLRTHMRTELKTLHRELGATFVFVTHDQVEAMSLADRIIIMSNGEIEQIGTPMELYNTPATRFVAGFIGSPPMNLFDLDTREAGQVAASFGKMPQSAASFGLRPEAIYLKSSHRKRMKAEVVLKEVLGSDTLLHVRIEQTLAAIMRVPSAETEGLGATIHVEIDPSAVCWFDRHGVRVER